MRESVSKSPDAASLGELSLHTIWQVQADPSYDVRRANDPATWIVVRTLGGDGRIRAGKQLYDLQRETLFVARLARIDRYRCQGASWRFWWFELSGDIPAELPQEEVLHVPSQSKEDEMFRQCFLLLRREDKAERLVAAATFQLLLRRWLAWRSRAESRHPHRDALERVIDAMHEHLETPWTVRDMAALAHLSERRFRQVFSAYTGSSPKQFYDGLRLSLARDLLKQGIYSVGEVADRLGYSSPFHFSRVFSQQFGVAPSTVGKPDS